MGVPWCCRAWLPPRLLSLVPCVRSGAGYPWVIICSDGSGTARAIGVRPAYRLPSVHMRAGAVCVPCAVCSPNPARVPGSQHAARWNRTCWRR